MRYCLYALLLNCLLAKPVKSQLVIANDKMSVVYAGVDNTLSIAAGGYDGRRIVLKASRGQLTKTGPGRYNWKLCDSLLGIVYFTAYYKTGKKLDSIGVNHFRVLRIPVDPFPVFIRGLGEDGTSPYRLIYNGLRLEFSFEYDMAFIPKSYEVEVVKNNKDTVRFKNFSNWYTQETTNALRALKPGNKVRIINMEALNECEGITRRLAPSYYFVY